VCLRVSVCNLMFACGFDRCVHEGMVGLLRSPRQCVWFHRLRLLEALLAFSLWGSTALLLMSASEPFARAGVPQLLVEIAVFGCIALIRLPGLLIVELRSLTLARCFEAGNLEVRAESARSVLESARPMIAMAMLSLFLHSLGLINDFTCQAVGPEDPLIMTCHTHYAVCCCLLAVNAGSFLSSVVILVTEPGFLHLTRETTPSRRLSQAQICKLLAHNVGDPRAPPMTQHCLICLDDFQPGEKVRHLPCGHHSL